MAIFEGIRRKRQITRLHEELEIQQLEHVKQLLESSPYPEPEPDEASWNLIAQLGGRTADLKQLTGLRLPDIRKVSRQLALLNSHYKGLLRNNISYIVGQGIILSANEKDPQAEARNEMWRRFAVRNHWIQRSKEIVWRSFRDGESFLHIKGEAESATARFLEPEWVRDPGDRVTYGIVTDDDDVETVLEYLYAPGETNQAETIPAQEVKHIKLGVDSSQKRGIPYYLSEFFKLKDTDSYIHRFLVYLNVATLVVLLRKHGPGIGPAQIKAFADAQKTGQKYNRKTGGYDRTQEIKSGTILDVPAGLTYEWQTPSLDARPIVQGCRQMLLSIAAGANQTEPMVSADASNANYASTMVAEGPPVKSFEDWQQFFGMHFLDVWRRVVGLEIDDPYQPSFTAPRIPSRKVLDEAKTNEILSMHGILSDKTWRERAGLDDDVETENLQQQAAESVAQPPKRKSATGTEEPEPEPEP